ncbi:glycosyltransferase [Streptomyces sp. WSLK1-5]|uniref:glycosyltransferase n=1 Tax=unclassified Streptomyces TaxID=2593676 RepID=UPI000F650D94|nr:glycosyltransferase [Streptomyces sp. RP5T]RRR86471.1 glycosyltransferase [Streptomyces sp. RP5T]
MLKVSIVVPVYNAGHYIDICAPSLLRQTLGEEAYEVIYVDDGSTDDSAQRLDALADQHAHVRVIHQENSGWPGKPRNVGVRAARGRYVQFVDQDDELTPEALEVLYRMADRNDSDIVLGKVIGTMAGPSNVFKRTMERCTVEDAPLMESLTPHKMFRRDFLLAHDLRFPEGPVRLEDQLFMVQAYLRAKTVSIVADHPCYVWKRRDDGGNNSSRGTTPEEYYGHLRTVVEAIKQDTHPGPLQNHLLRRSYRVELLRPVNEPRALQRTGKNLERYFDVVRRMALDAYPPGVRDGLPALTRLRAHLLEEGHLDSLVELARRTRRIRPEVTVDDIRWRDGKLHVTTTIGMRRGDGEPLALVERYGRMLLDPDLLAGIKGAEGWEAPHPLGHAHGELLVHDTARDLWWYPDADLVPRTQPLGDRRHRVVLGGETAIDPLTLAGGRAMEPGTHVVWASAQLLGVGRRARVTRADDDAHRGAAPDLGLGAGLGLGFGSVRVGTPPHLVIPAWSGSAGQLRLSVRPPGQATLPHRLYLRTTSAPPLRRAARTVLHRLPADVRGRAKRLARRADPWSGA